MKQDEGQLQVCHDREAWDDYVLDNGGHPLQLWGWGQTKAQHGWTAERFFLRDESDTVVAGAQVLTRHLPYPFRALSYIPRGPVGTTNPSVQTRLLSLIAKRVKNVHKSVALSVEPETLTFSLPHGWRKGSQSILPAQTVQLDLTESESDLLADMAKKTRQYIRKSAADAGDIRQVKTLAELDHVLKLYHHTAQRARFMLHSDDYYRDNFTQLADNAVIYASYKDDEPIAFLWLAVSTDTAFELYGGMSDVGAELRANYALKWHAIRKAKEWGLRIYDFGGIVSGGVATFKAGWASHETELAGTFDIPLSRWYSAWTKGLPLAKRVVRGTKRILKR